MHGIQTDCSNQRNWIARLRSLGRIQPPKVSIFWNPNGYEWTGVFKVEVTVN
jgi:hypothetical protein